MNKADTSSMVRAISQVTSLILFIIISGEQRGGNLYQKYHILSDFIPKQRDFLRNAVATQSFEENKKLRCTPQ